MSNILDYSGPKKVPSDAKPARMGALAVLPVFYKLQGKKVALAGGGEAAAWKAELISAAGAHVDIYATEICDEMATLLSRGPEGGGSLVLHNRVWATDCFENVQMAVADFENEGEANAFYCAAKAAQVPVNVIDKPKFCDFQFGGIVNRSPAIISISTDGAAPILGQAIRRRIETLIPTSVQAWAGLARDLRSSVNAKLPMGGLRRQFWEKFSNLAFARAPKADEADTLQALLAGVSNSDNDGGRVTLVGAGPGDAELLTLGAVRALQSADVILFDDLASDAVLELARREAKRLLVGKRGGRESCKQEDINDMMVSLAGQGKHVVRLKSGDPTIFGRAGEEIARLEAENIPVTIVPGITSASAMAAQLGVSLTHRDHAQSVRFVTGHSRQGKLPEDIDWRGIADPHSTTIFYMGGRTAAQITNRLEAEGLSLATPVVIMSSISRANETRWTGTLGQLPQGIAEIGYDNPVLIGVGAALGEAAAFRQSATLDSIVEK